MFVPKNEMERAESWVEKWSDKELVEQITMFDNIMELDNIDNFIFLDEIMQLWMYMLQESVYRLEKTLPIEK